MPTISNFGEYGYSVMLTYLNPIYVVCYLLQMASRISNSRQKRQSSHIGSYALPYDEHKFRSFMHEQYYTELETKYLIQEKMVESEDSGEYYDVAQEINAQGWGILTTLNEFVNLEIIQ